MVFLFNTIAMIFNISADCLHHMGISVSGDDSLIISNIACLLTTKHNFLRNLFCFKFHISDLFPRTVILICPFMWSDTNLSASTNLSVLTNELRWLFWFNFASITFGITIKCAISGTKSLPLPTQPYCLICKAAKTNMYFRFLFTLPTKSQNDSSNHATSPTSGDRTY